MWNVPSIIRAADSLGIVFADFMDKDTTIIRIPQEMRCGEKYSISIEIDSSFPESEYNVTWTSSGIEHNLQNSKSQYSVLLSEKDVAEEHIVDCRAISNKPWHKYGNWDSRLLIVMKVFSPLE